MSGTELLNPGNFMFDRSLFCLNETMVDGPFDSFGTGAGCQKD